MNPLSKFVAATLFIVCCGAAPASNGNNSNDNSGRPTQARINALDVAAAKRDHYIDPFTLREVASDTMFRKVIAERMKNKIKPPKFHKHPRSPNKPDEDDDDHDHGIGNDDHDHGPHDDHDNGNHNGQGNHDDDHGNGNGNANGNHGNGNSDHDSDKKDDKNDSRTPTRRYR